ncbi:transposase [Leptospira neocaledonica]|uniref:transposase n=1 Tax=Leptospira neocaledonica TaxID=2023192 RepID=UPI001FCA5BC9|nr:transposase [Leptospira neocaledonica]
MSDKLGGKQIGTMVHTIAASNGALILDSVPNQKMNTLGPLFKKSIPDNTAIFTDSGYPWLSVYRNHRMVNHTAHSKDKRHRWARNRWSKDGVHVQYAEGNHRVIKQAFSSYGYIRPEYSQLYLNEFCFYKNLKVFGLDALVAKWREKIGVVEKREEEERPDGLNSRYSSRIQTDVRIVKKKYEQGGSFIPNKLEKWLYAPLSLSDRKLQLSYTNESFIKRNKNLLSKSKFKALKIAITNNDEFWNDPEIKYYKRYSEKKYSHFAKLIWANISDSSFNPISHIINRYRIPHSSAYRIMRIWKRNAIIEYYEGKYRPYIELSKNYMLKRKFTELPNLLYSSHSEQVRSVCNDR